MKVLLSHKHEVYNITGYHVRVKAIRYSDYSHGVEAEKKVGPGENELAFDTVWLYQGSYQECIEVFDALLENELEGYKLFTIGCDGTPKPKPLTPENDPDFDF